MGDIKTPTQSVFCSTETELEATCWIGYLFIYLVGPLNIISVNSIPLQYISKMGTFVIITMDFSIRVFLKYDT